MYSKMQLSVSIIGLTSILTLIGHIEARPGHDHDGVNGWLDYMPYNCLKQKEHFCAEPHEKALQKHIDDLIGENKLELLPERNPNRVGEDTPQSCKIRQRRPNPMRVYNIYDTRGRVRIVVQSEKRRVSQEFSIEECLKPDSTIVKYHKSRLLCQQVTMDYSYLVLTLNGTDFEMIKSEYQFPVYCDELMLKD